MRYLAAYLLLVLGGKADPSPSDVEGVITGAGGKVDKAELEKVVNALKGKKIHELVAEGTKKLGTMSFGGSAGGDAGKTEAKKEEPKKEAAKKEVKKEEPKKEEPADDDVGLGGGLFDDF